MLEVSTTDGIAVITLAHGKANALDVELCQGIAESLGSAAADAKAIVITGRGNIFSAGVDLKRILGEPPSYVEEFFPALCRLFEEVFFLPKPVVAALNGHTIAGGCVLACAADFRIAASGDHRLGVPELLVGLPFPHVALEILRSCLDPARFRGLLYRGFLVDPATAKASGIVDEVTAPDSVLERALAIAGELGALTPATFAISKHQMRAPARTRLAGLSREERDRVTSAWTAPGTRDVIRDYVERTFGS